MTWYKTKPQVFYQSLVLFWQISFNGVNPQNLEKTFTQLSGQDTVEDVYQRGFKHCWSKRFRGFIQNHHVAPFVHLVKFVPVDAFGPTPGCIVTISNFEDHGLMLCKKSHHCRFGMAKNFAGSCPFWWEHGIKKVTVVVTSCQTGEIWWIHKWSQPCSRGLTESKLRYASIGLDISARLDRFSFIITCAKTFWIPASWPWKRSQAFLQWQHSIGHGSMGVWKWGLRIYCLWKKWTELSNMWFPHVSTEYDKQIVVQTSFPILPRDISVTGKKIQELIECSFIVHGMAYCLLKQRHTASSHKAFTSSNLNTHASFGTSYWSSQPTWVWNGFWTSQSIYLYVYTHIFLFIVKWKYDISIHSIS